MTAGAAAPAPPVVPLISVLMALYGRGDLAVRALTSLAATADVPYEVIVVDNASPDRSADVVAAAHPTARLIRQRMNAGFGAAIDHAAMHARGEFVLVLNSDVVFEPGWLAPLLDVLARRPTVAAVSPALVTVGEPVVGGRREDDVIAVELGSAIFGDGATGVIEGHDPWDHLRPRAVPYASAACLLVRRRAFAAVGGLDTVYPRGYYEDVELAIDLRRRGWSVFCDPRARVRHLRGASSGAARAARLITSNREVFRRRHADDIAGLLPAARSTPTRKRDSIAVDRLLVIDDRIPNVDRGSGDPRMARLLARLAALAPEATVTLLTTDPTRVERYAVPLATEGVELADWSGGTPEAWLAARAHHYSAVVVSRSHNVVRFGPVLDATQPQALRVVDVEAVTSIRQSRRADLLKSLGDRRWRECAEVAQRTLADEIEGWRRADIVLCVSDEEAEFVDRLAPGREIILVAATVDPPERIVARGDRRGMVFLGGFMSGDDAPNADTVQYLADDVLPAVWAREPAVTLDVLGADPTHAVSARRGDRITVGGPVVDPVQALGRYLVKLAPVRFGSGIKLKFLDAMAAGTPFVTTPVGAEGLHLGSLTDVLVGTTPEQLSDRAVHLLTDAALWEATHTELLHLARTRFGPPAFDGSVRRLLTSVGVVSG